MTSFRSSPFYKSIRFPTLIIAILWLVQLVQISGIRLAGLGVYPRHPEGIKGIFLSPFIHSQDLMHLVNNSIPLFVSMVLILLFFKRVAYPAFFVIWILTGAGVWLFARSVFHIGASGVVYGFISFIFWNGIFRRNIKSIVLSLIIMMLYSGMLLGVLPNQPGVSWESHLIGGIVGILASFLFRHQLEQDEQLVQSNVDETTADPDFFLDRDTFERTKVERQDRGGGWFSDSTF